MLLEVTLGLHLLLPQWWLPKTSNTRPLARLSVMCVTVRILGRRTFDAPSWKCHGTQENGASWRSQGAPGVPHRDNSLLKSSWEAVGSLDAPSWKYSSIHQGDTSWGSLRAQPSPKTRSFHFIHLKQYGAFPRRIVLPYHFSEIFSGYEEDVSAIQDEFTAWLKCHRETILKRHVVDSKCIYPAYREAPARRHSPSSSG